MFPSSRYIRRAAALTVLAGSIGTAAASCPAHCYDSHAVSDGKVVCEECWVGYKLSADETSCEPLADPHCYTPNPQDEKKCDECGGDGYWPNSDGICVSCGDNCSTCKDDKTCKHCKSGYGPNADGQCVKCIDSCNSCTDTTTCDRCAGGYAKDDKNECAKCMDNCVYCQDVTTCTQCAPGYSFIEGECKSCGVGNCQSCQTVGTCQTCFSNYASKEGKCELCETQEGCEYMGSGCTCGNCKQGYKLNNGVCDRDETVCFSGQGMKDGKCVPCSLKYCTACSFDDTGVETCTQCDTTPDGASAPYTSCWKTLEDCTEEDDANNGGGNGALSPRTLFSTLAVVAGLIAATLV
ncbi:hypothetical protein, conserved [Angomonas deanei]|uniref:Uncharacterized protein n=1 Tax=Angomonas deanei TaxID=59799 RepID=A0A7G2CKU6_9TRYP|nr:hypothetical protein, conserved [Angomonas deanei]